MNYIELSIDDVKEKSKKLYKEIIKDYKYDLVIFIAKGSYLIGRELSVLANVPLLEIYATRKGGKLKRLLKPVFRLVPKKVLIELRKREVNSDYHDKNSDRQVSFDKKEYSKYEDSKKILLVDDSIDSGNSVILVKKALEEYFKKAEIRTAVFNVMSKSAVNANYTIYNDMMLNGPWSNDSLDNDLHTKLYNNWVKNKKIKSSTKTVSVAMATYNGRDFIEQQIDSILTNLNEKDELIISDDGSNDGTLEIIISRSKNDKRIKIFNGPKKGVIKNFENALKNCSNEYIFLADQDDIWFEEKKKIVMSYFEEKNYMAIVHDAIVIDENNKKIMNSWYKHRNSKKGFIANIIKNRYLGCCMAFDRRLLDYSMPIPENIEMHDWWLGLNAELNGKTKFINEPLFAYRRHSKNVSSLSHYRFKKMVKNRLTLIIEIIKKIIKK